jgi:hypothetical protein
VHVVTHCHYYQMAAVLKGVEVLRFEQSVEALVA